MHRGPWVVHSGSIGKQRLRHGQGRNTFHAARRIIKNMRKMLMMMLMMVMLVIDDDGDDDE